MARYRKSPSMQVSHAPTATASSVAEAASIATTARLVRDSPQRSATSPDRWRRGNVSSCGNIRRWNTSLISSRSPIPMPPFPVWSSSMKRLWTLMTWWASWLGRAPTAWATSCCIIWRNYGGGISWWWNMAWNPPMTPCCVASTAAMILPVISVQPSWHVSAGWRCVPT